MTEVTSASDTDTASFTTLLNTVLSFTLSSTDVCEDFDNNLVSMFHNNSEDEKGDDDDDDDDNDDNDDNASNIETDIEKKSDVSLSIQNCLKLINTIIAQTSDSMQSVINVKKLFTAAAYNEALA
ncbi:hypothetical protein GX50_03884 [[Emmonsia] crescens]|uniref:Uncharacterized protein n=1 Tax=[Emmonsia] crescens TaxID=73230 RepID=A0A2B7ZIZ9_9EURO|nr:hypothetical protein GX50_03884 [Emmonsia crescens]